MDLKNNLRTETGWEIIEKHFDPDQLVTTGSNFMIGNGYLGYRGTFAEWEADRYVACVVTDTWDMAEGSEWSELCTVPNALFTQLLVDGERLSAFTGESADDYRALDLRHGLNQRKTLWTAESGKRVRLEVEKFASYDNVHVVPMRYTFEALDDAEFTLVTGIDGEIWSLNGEHFVSYETFSQDDVLGMETVTGEFGIRIDVVEGVRLRGAEPTDVDVVEEERRILRRYTFALTAGERVTVEKVMVLYHSNDLATPRAQALTVAADALEAGYEALKTAHVPHWDEIWQASDLTIEGNLEDQVITRFNLYHATIATPTHAQLPIGARGLSCQVYQGAAFWDQETFNLPMYIYARPDIARRVLEYRYATLPGARHKAKRLGYDGAFYAWTSGKTGKELFPDYFFTNVLTGRKIHNHFNSWQIHISPDIVYALWRYYEATGDWAFVLDYGAEIAFEVARFLVSRAHFKMDKGRYEYIRLLGPDEYHENVDNNAYTNYLAHFALEKAGYIYHRMQVEAPDRLEALLERLQMDEHDVAAWQDMVARIYLPQPDPETKLIEQCDGFFDLEEITPEQLRERLIDPEEYWGWPNGIAVEAQVLKQADVLQLFALLPIFSKDVMRANYDYYEPHTEHGSSLSPSVHALIASCVDYADEAYRYFKEASTIDLYNASKKVMSGGTFLGGIHTAACGGVWLMVVQGFAGLKVDAHGLHLTPRLPDAWEALGFQLVYRYNTVAVNVSHHDVHLQADNENARPLIVHVNDAQIELAPGEREVVPLQLSPKTV
jgi:kojibiose phosphorylase